MIQFISSDHLLFMESQQYNIKKNKLYNKTCKYSWMQHCGFVNEHYCTKNEHIGKDLKKKNRGRNKQIIKKKCKAYSWNLK